MSEKSLKGRVVDLLDKEINKKNQKTLLIVVGCTSAEGNEKSQYLENVFCNGIDFKKKFFSKKCRV